MENVRLEIFTDQELKIALDELFASPAFLQGMAAFLSPELNALILQEKERVKNVYDLQKNIITPFLKFIHKISISDLTASGLENLNAEDKYLFISNHRDIGLDSAFMNMVLLENGINTSQIAVGDNLLKHRMAELIFRVNKSFPVVRSGTPRELYGHSVQLSKYIHDIIVEKMDSVWIAQREGRAKDGNDRTQNGLLKMLSLSHENGIKTHFKELAVAPVTITYEYDPCDKEKMLEHLKKQADPSYKKTFQEDMQQIFMGLKGWKGRVHFHFDKPMSDALDIFDDLANSKLQLEALANLIDKSIHLNYKLHPVNYIAFDLLDGNNRFVNKYTADELAYHISFFEKKLVGLQPEEYEIGRQYLLGIYGNPVKNALGYE